MSKNILLLETVSAEADTLLRANAKVFEAAPDQGASVAKEYPIHAIVTRGKGQVNQELISMCPDLRVIARCGVGLDNVDVDFATQRGVKVVNAPGSNADTVAEHALGLMLSLQRQLHHSIDAVKNNNWAFRNAYSGDEIRDKTLGIVGMGNIGRRVAKLAEAFGMRIQSWDIFQNSELNYPFAKLEQLLSTSDIVTLHLPYTPQTKHLINAEALAKMSAHALLINTARGEIIDQSALVTALNSKAIGGFAGDVLEQEPPTVEDIWLQLNNVLVTPHSASLTARTYNYMCVLTVQNTLDLLENKTIDIRYIFNRNKLTNS